ncbi:MAG: NifU family protein [Crocinitomicaceae bacterium]|nr:NifU family protein [Crocinitomicaceae bacterium]
MYSLQTMELREFIKEWISNSKDVLIQMPTPKVQVAEGSDESPIEFNASDFDDPIKALLDQYVRPAVENDGGAIDFLGFQDGKVTVLEPSATCTFGVGI